MSRRLFKEDIDKYRFSDGCIPESAKVYIDTQGRIDFKSWKEDNPDDYENFERTAIKCSEDFYNGESKGCCYTENNNLTCEGGEKHNMGLKFLGFDDKTGTICHKEPIQSLFDFSLDDPNHIVKFFKLLLFSILTLLVTAIIGTCYEFWLRYGNSIECIYYKSKCANIGKSEKISLIDYMFPNNISYYPYQSCSASKTGQSGGAKSEGIISTFAEYQMSGAKCITLDYDGTIYGKKPIPYNIADLAENNVRSEFILVLAKTISFYFLFPVLFARKFLNYCGNRLSGSYQRVVKFNPFLSNFIFLLLTGLFFPLLAYFTGNTGLYYGPMYILTSILGIVGFIMSFGFIITLISTLFPSRFYGVSLARCNAEPSYYQIFKSKLFFPLTEMSLNQKVFNILKNLLIAFPIIFLVIFSLFLGGIMSVVSSIYMGISLFFNFFYVPLSNPLECFSILKSHGDILTIIFCMSVIGSANESLDKITTGIMAAILMIIIVFKSIKGMNSSI